MNTMSLIDDNCIVLIAGRGPQGLVLAPHGGVEQPRTRLRQRDRRLAPAAPWGEVDSLTAELLRLSLLTCKI